MRKTYFDVRLYREAMRQLKVIGLMGLVILCLSAFLTPLGYIIDGVSAMYSGRTVEIYAEQVRLLDIHPLLPVCYMVMAPLMTLYLFHFMDKRDTSDFYHSIPQTRICLFNSFFAAIVTWLVVIIGGSTLLAGVMCGIGSDYLALNLASVPSLCFQILAASFLVAASVAVAMCLTGTVFTNVMVSGILIFLPRLILLVATECIDSALPFVAGDYAFKLLDYQINVVTGTIFGVVMGNPTDVLYNYSSGIYTLILAILYAVIAGILFQKRKSESAGHAAQGWKMQLAIRLTVAMVICLIPVVFIFDSLANGYSMIVSEIFLMAVFYVIAAVVYFLYELISTKKWRNMIKAIPGLVILALVNVVMVLGMYGIFRFHSNVLPEPDEIDYVTLPAESVYNYWFPQNEEEYYDYFDSSVEEVRLESQAVKEMISKRLKETVVYYTEDAYILSSEQRTMDKTVAINTGLMTYHRYIKMSEADIHMLMEELKSHEQVAQTYMELPVMDGKRVVSDSYSSIGQESLKIVYDTMREEIKEIGFENWYEIQEGQDMLEDKLDTLAIGLYQGTRHCIAELPVVTGLPKTWEKYMERVILHENREQREMAVQAVKENDKVSYFSIVRRCDKIETFWNSSEAGSFFDPATGEELVVCKAHPTGDVVALTDEFREILAPMLVDAVSVVPKAGDPYYKVYVEWMTLDEYGNDMYMGYEGYFALNEELMPEEMLKVLKEAE